MARSEHTERQDDRAALLKHAVLGETPPMRVLERVLELLEFCSLGHQVRELVWRRRPVGACLEDVRQETTWRYYAAAALDWYILGWVVLEVFVLAVALEWLPTAVLVVLAAYRLVEIVQVFANAVLFDRKRSMEKRGVVFYMLLSVPRSITHAVVLLGETILCFAILFYAGRGGFGHLEVTGAVDALDTSLRTITTIGPGATAHGAFRLVVDLEPVFGLLFAGTVLARAVAALPAVGDTQDAPAQMRYSADPELVAPDRGAERAAE